MKYQLLLPAAMIVMSLGAAVVYGCLGDWRHAGYWLSAAAITFFVTV